MMINESGDTSSSVTNSCANSVECMATGSCATCNGCSIAIARIYKKYEEYLNNLFAETFKTQSEAMFNKLHEANLALETVTDWSRRLLLKNKEWLRWWFSWWWWWWWMYKKEWKNSHLSNRLRSVMVCDDKRQIKALDYKKSKKECLPAFLTQKTAHFQPYKSSFVCLRVMRRHKWQDRLNAEWLIEAEEWLIIWLILIENYHLLACLA